MTVAFGSAYRGSNPCAGTGQSNQRPRRLYRKRTGNSAARLASLTARFWSKVDKSGPVMRPGLTPCWEWTGPTTRRGYGAAVLDGVRGAHRVALHLATGGLPADAHVCHHCDNKRCVNPDHLYAGDPATNARDSVERGRSPAGERNGSAKLTAAQVVEIRAMLASGERKTEVARRFGVTDVLVHYIAIGRVWRADLLDVGEEQGEARKA